MLKGRIERNGTLTLIRAGFRTSPLCPRTGKHCGDWCPLFDQNGEPPAVSEMPNTFYVLRLCDAELALAEFKDEREWNETETKES